MSELSTHVTAAPAAGQSTAAASAPELFARFHGADPAELMLAKLAFAAIFLALAIAIFRWAPKRDRLDRTARVALPALLALIGAHELVQVATLFGAWLACRGVALI